MPRIHPVTISLNGKQIGSVTTFKYLRLILHSHLQFHDRIELIVDKTSMKLGLLYKTCWLFDKETPLMLFKSLITPHFDFVLVVYELCLHYQLN